MDIAQREAGGGGDGIVDQARAFGNAGHALACGVELQPRAAVMRLKQGAGIGADIDGHAKGGCNGIGGDVIMGGADPARGEDMVIGGAQRVDGGNNRSRVICHDAAFAQRNAVPRQLARQVEGIAVTGASRQDFVADHQHGCGWIGHRMLLFP